MGHALTERITIPNGESLSTTAIRTSLKTNVLVAIDTPENLEGAAIRFEASADNGVSYKVVTDEVDIAYEVKFTAGAESDRYRLVDGSLLAGLYDVKLRTVTGAGAAQTQTGDAVFTLVFRPWV